MRNARDTFLRFLADNLQGITVHGLRRDPNKPDGDKLQMNAINVHFINVNLGVQQSSYLVAIDVINDDELTAIDWATQVWNLLNRRFYTPQMDYSQDVANPTPTGTNIMWDRNGVRFRPVVSDFYYHFTSNLYLHFYTPIS